MRVAFVINSLRDGGAERVLSNIFQSSSARAHEIDLVLLDQEPEQRAMPAFGPMMSDDQVAAVVNYLRTHFGNTHTDAVTAEDVKAARP